MEKYRTLFWIVVVSAFVSMLAFWLILRAVAAFVQELRA